MERKEEIEKKVMEGLDQEWHSTARIAHETRLNFYEVYDALNDLHKAGKIERRRAEGIIARSNYWRLLPKK